MAMYSNFLAFFYHNTDIILSGIILLCFVIAIIFFREITFTFSNTILNLFSYKKQSVSENKLSNVTQRNLTAALCSLLFPLILLILFGEKFSEISGYNKFILFPVILGFILAYWIFKSMVLRFTGWLTKNNQLFSLIGKLGYNHFIISAILTLLVVFLLLFNISPELDLIAKYLLYSYSAVYILYLIRAYQAIKASRFSHFFYILYLCSAELLPIALLTNFLLSYN